MPFGRGVADPTKPHHYLCYQAEVGRSVSKGVGTNIEEPENFWSAGVPPRNGHTPPPYRSPRSLVRWDKITPVRMLYDACCKNLPVYV